MKISQIQTKNKNRVNIEELHALSSAYGERLKNKEIASLVGYPAVVLSIFVYLLTYRWWTVVITLIAGAIYGYRFVLPRVIHRRYEMQSLVARNSFLNNMTQVMSDQSRTVSQSLHYVMGRTQGELKGDVKILLAALTVGSDPERVTELLNKFSLKYEDDTVLSQYFEQLETLIYEGKNNVDVLQDLTEQHNRVLNKVKEFNRLKDQYLSGVKVLVALALGLIALFHGVSIILNKNLDLYIEGFAHSVIGTVSTIAFVISFVVVLNSFFKKYFDDSITELGVRTRK